MLVAVQGCLSAALDGFANGADPDGAPPPEAPSDDGGPGLADSGDAQLGGDASTEKEDAGPPNLLQNGDFELGCAKWKTFFAFMSEAPGMGRNGSAACELCMDTNWEATLEQVLERPIAKGDRLAGEVWVKPAKPTSELASAGLVGTSLMLSTSEDLDETSGPAIPSDWVRITTIFDAKDAASALEFTVRLRQSGNPASVGNVICVYVDDAALRATP